MKLVTRQVRGLRTYRPHRFFRPPTRKKFRSHRLGPPNAPKPILLLNDEDWARVMEGDGTFSWRRTFKHPIHPVLQEQMVAGCGIFVRHAFRTICNNDEIFNAARAAAFALSEELIVHD